MLAVVVTYTILPSHVGCWPWVVLIGAINHAPSFLQVFVHDPGEKLLVVSSQLA